MTDKIIPIGKKRKKATLQYCYPLIRMEDISATYELEPILYKKDELQDFSVLFFHRLMIRNYGDPSEIKLDNVKKTKKNITIRSCKEWLYFLRTPSGDVILVGTKEKHSLLQICHVVDHKKFPSKKAEENG